MASVLDVSRTVPCCQHTASPVSPGTCLGLARGKLPVPPHSPGMLPAGLVAMCLQDAGVLQVTGSSHHAWLLSTPRALLLWSEQ